MSAFLRFAKEIWRDPVWSKVIATGIIAVAVYFFPWWKLVIQQANIFLMFLLQSSEISNWLFMLLALCATLVAIILIALLWQIIMPKNSILSWKESYFQDNFFNILWRWSYDYKGQPDRIFTFCPDCDFQIYAQNSSYFDTVPHTLFHCECCNKTLYEFQGRYDELENKVIRFLQQKVRNGSWNKSQIES